MPPTMTPQEFVDKWRPIALKESAAAKEHFIDLCRLLGHETPAEGEPKVAYYTLVAGASSADLRTRTLTNLYNRRPTWLENAHRALDEAVFAAYGWPADLADEEVLASLLALNLERAR